MRPPSTQRPEYWLCGGDTPLSSHLVVLSMRQRPGGPIFTLISLTPFNSPVMPTYHCTDEEAKAAKHAAARKEPRASDEDTAFPPLAGPTQWGGPPFPSGCPATKRRLKLDVQPLASSPCRKRTVPVKKPPGQKGSPGREGDRENRF